MVKRSKVPFLDYDQLFIIFSNSCSNLSANLLNSYMISTLTKCSIAFSSISFQRPAVFSLTRLSRSDRNIEITSESKSFICLSSVWSSQHRSPFYTLYRFCRDFHQGLFCLLFVSYSINVIGKRKVQIFLPPKLTSPLCSSRASDMNRSRNMLKSVGGRRHSPYYSLPELHLWSCRRAAQYCELNFALTLYFRMVALKAVCHNIRSKTLI